MGRPQVVRVGNTTSATLILNMGAPQGCVHSTLLHGQHDSNTIIQFADDTAGVA